MEILQKQLETMKELLKLKDEHIQMLTEKIVRLESKSKIIQDISDISSSSGATITFNTGKTLPINNCVSAWSVDGLGTVLGIK